MSELKDYIEKRGNDLVKDLPEGREKELGIAMNKLTVILAMAYTKGQKFYHPFDTTEAVRDLKERSSFADMMECIKPETIDFIEKICNCAIKDYVKNNIPLQLNITPIQADNGSAAPITIADIEKICNSINGAEEVMLMYYKGEEVGLYHTNEDTPDRMILEYLRQHPEKLQPMLVELGHNHTTNEQ